MVLEHSPVQNHPANGVAERAVQDVEGLVRTHHSALEERIQCTIPVVHPVMTWLIPHCVNLSNCCLVGPDGKTPYERQQLKPLAGEITDFGSDVYYATTGDLKGGSLEPRYVEGIFLGKRYQENI